MTNYTPEQVEELVKAASEFVRSRTTSEMSSGFVSAKMLKLNEALAPFTRKPKVYLLPTWEELGVEVSCRINDFAPADLSWMTVRHLYNAIREATAKEAE